MAALTMVPIIAKEGVEAFDGDKCDECDWLAAEARIDKMGTGPIRLRRVGSALAKHRNVKSRCKPFPEQFSRMSKRPLKSGRWDRATD